MKKKDEFNAAETEKFVSTFVEDENGNIVVNIHIHYGDLITRSYWISTILKFEMHVLKQMKKV